MYSRLLGLFLVSTFVESQRTNVLFIMFDDLRPLMGAYGHDYMITPNFDRLAAKSVIFDSAHCQVSVRIGYNENYAILNLYAMQVCSPSRSSLLSGLRPDTIKSYTFTTTFRPFQTFPEQFSRTGFNTAGYGKILHGIDIPDNLNIGHGIVASGWYPYQNKEGSLLNSSVQPDRVTPEHEFRDYEFASRAIDGLRTLSSRNEFFLLGLGFKLPHTMLHFPHKYFEMYRSRSSRWANVKENYLRFPPSAPSPSYRCCAYFDFNYLNQEGSQRHSQSTAMVPNMSAPTPPRVHLELMWAYASAVSFADSQLGRVLDAVDDLKLWGNLTIVLTSDHGMHNGEKGMWCVNRSC
jgi:iduronate 2-sulfatase